MRFINISKVTVLNDVTNYASKSFKIPLKTLLSSDRARHISAVRFIVFRALYERMHLPSTIIARFFNKDHSSVIYGIEMAKKKALDADYEHFVRNYLFSTRAKAVDNMGVSGDKKGSVGSTDESCPSLPSANPQLSPKRSVKRSGKAKLSSGTEQSDSS